MNTKVVAYARVSTEEQASSGFSLDAQIQKMEAYAGLYDLDIVEVIVDSGVSAKSLNRPGISKALTMLSLGDADGLLVVKLDRMTRSVKDLGYLMENQFSDKGSKLYSVEEQIDTSTAMGRMMANLMTTISQWEREVIGERTKSALDYKRSQGDKLGGRTPFGFTVKVVNGVKKLVPDATQQAIAAFIVSGKKTGRKLKDLQEEIPKKFGMTISYSTVKKVASQEGIK